MSTVNNWMVKEIWRKISRTNIQSALVYSNSQFNRPKHKTTFWLCDVTFWDFARLSMLLLEIKKENGNILLRASSLLNAMKGDVSWEWLSLNKYHVIGKILLAGGFLYHNLSKKMKSDCSWNTKLKHFQSWNSCILQVWICSL